MQRWIWILVAISVSTAVYFTIRYGLRPKPIPVLNPTSFERPDQIGIVVYKRLRQNIRGERIVLLGINKELSQNLEVWLGLLRAASADKEHVVVFSALPELPIPSGENVEVVPYSEEATRSGALLDQAHERMKGGQLVVLLAPSDQVSHLVPNSLSQQTDRRVGHPVLSISSLPFVVVEPANVEFESECLEPGKELDPSLRLSCAARRVSRKFYKKKLAPEKIWAVMERHGLKEYLLFIHHP